MIDPRHYKFGRYTCLFSKFFAPFRCCTGLKKPFRRFDTGHDELGGISFADTLDFCDFVIHILVF